MRSALVADRGIIVVLALLALACSISGCEQLPNLPPTASFIYSPVSPIYAGQTVVVFNASASRDSNGHITNYIWNFGDTTPEQNLSASTTSHVFPSTPLRCIQVTYTVLLTVVDDKGVPSSANAPVTVIELPAPTSAECQAR